uniref:Talin-1 n=1 Tax=Magallana gigas TaxID=29159 RepID=A0A8W8NJ43_MAGGI
MEIILFVVAPTISSLACQEQLIDAAKGVAHSVEGIVEAAQQSCHDDKLLADLGAAATAVTQALNDLLQHIKKGAGPTAAGESHEDAVDTILTVTDRLFSSVGDAHEMVRQARQLAQATSSLVGAIRGEAERHSDSDMQKRLLAAARQLADATANMVEAAKGCASSPNDSEQQKRLRGAAEDLRAATNIAASNALKKKLIRRLENAARHTASATTQLINASKNANKSNTNKTSEHQLTQQCQLPLLIQGFRGSETNQDSATAQLQLINASKEFIQPASQLVSAANTAAPTVGDQAASMNMNQAVKTMTTALAELRTASGKAEEMCISLEVDAALDQLTELDRELEEYRRAADSGNLVPLPGETVEASAMKLGSTSKDVGSAMAQLLTAASQGNENYVGVAARDTANALRVLTEATRGVASTSEDIKVRRQVIDSAHDVIDKSTHLLEETKRAMNDPENPENQARLNQVAKAVSSALNNCVNALPGQRDVDNAIRQITDSSQELASTKYPSTDRTFQEIQIEINAAVNLNQAASDIVTASRGTPKQLAESSGEYSSSYSEFIKSGLTMAGLSKDGDTQNQIVGGLKNVSMVSSKLLLAAKSVSADPNAPNTKNLLPQAARAVTESINQLINVCTVSAPGQKECDNAFRQIQMMKSILESANEPVTDLSYFECLDSVMEKSKGDLENFCDSVANFSTSVCGLTEAASQVRDRLKSLHVEEQSLYTGIDLRPTLWALLMERQSTEGPGCWTSPSLPGLTRPYRWRVRTWLTWPAPSNKYVVNQWFISGGLMTYLWTCTEPGQSSPVLSAATVVAKHTSALCNACHLASSKTSNPVAKRHFVQSAKDVANSTANLVKAIKALDQDFTEENRQRCAEAAKPLTDAVDELTTFASSPEFANMPACQPKSAQRKAQEPIVSAGKAMIDGACHMVTAAKQLAVNPKDPPTYQLYSSHPKSVSEAIKRLVSSIKDCVPGQRECDESIDKLNRSIHDLDQASLAAISQSLQQRTEKSLRGFQEQMIGSAREIHDLCSKVKDLAKAEPENMGHRVTMMASYFGPLSDGPVGAASLIQNSKQQTHILDLTKTVAESALQFMYSCKEGGGNPKAPKHNHDNIDTAADNTMDVVQDLLQSLEEPPHRPA